MPRPEPGKPILLSTGEAYYLRDDAKQYSDCSDIVLSYWREKKSLQRPGPALRSRLFYVVSGRERGRSKLLRAWLGADLEDIAAGKEGTNPERGRGHYARSYHLANRNKAEAFMKTLRGNLPLLAADAYGQCLREGFTHPQIYRAKKAVGIKTRSVPTEGKAHIYWWCRPGQNPPAPHAGGLAELQQSAASATPAAKDDAANGHPRVEETEPVWNVRPVQRPDDPPLRAVLVEEEESANARDARRLQNAMASARDLAEEYKVNDTALDARLKRWRYAHKEETGKGWIQVADSAGRMPRFLYAMRVALPIIEQLRAHG